MRDKNRFLCNIYCDVQKSIKIDKYTYEIINNYRGYSFSEKIRNYVFDHEEKMIKSNTKFLQKKSITNIPD